jgi:hypothetical protein
MRICSRAKTLSRWLEAARDAGWFLLLLLTGAGQAQDFTYTNTNGSITITGYTGPGGTVTIPSTIDGLAVTAIGAAAFANFGSLTNVIIGQGVSNSVTVIGDSTFLNCSNLTSITIGNNVAYVANWAFFGCSGLTTLTLPDTVTNIQNAEVGGMGLGVNGGVFYGCTSLTNVIVGKGLSYLGLGAFSYCTNMLSVYFKGDAPIPGTFMPGPVYVFSSDDPTTVYYLPGTSGWGAAYAGRPAKLWNPQAQTRDATFGVRQNRFGFNVTGTADIPLVIEASTEVVAESWVPLESCTLTNGLIYFSDSQWTNYPSRFCRIRSP